VKRKIFFIAVALLGGFLFCAKQSFASTEIRGDITSDTTWDEAGSPYLVYGTISVNEPLTIKPGVIVKFQYYGIGPAGCLSVKNELNAVGTPENPIIFTSLRDDEAGGDNNEGGSNPSRGDWYGINIYNSVFNSKLENVSIRYATNGFRYQDYSSSNYRGLIIRNSEIKYNEVGIYVYNTLPVIENNKIENNKTGIYAYTSKAGRVPTIKNNSIAGNITGLDAKDVSYGKKIDARHNWWGKVSGPYQADRDPNGEYGDKIVGSYVVFDPWLADIPQAMPKKPVILIPGIGGSVNWDLMIGGVFPEKWTLMSHTYDGIIEALESMGYEKGKSLFVCYYDWRNNNSISGENYLKPIVDDALAQSGANQVNIIAHSMGGLVARSYIQNANYANRNDVENLIMIGTPNRGSSDVYPVWEGGRIPNNWETRSLFRAYLWLLNVKGLTLNNYQSVHQYIPSVKELIPVYNYLHPVGQPSLLYNYAQLKERNDWLISLNSQIALLNEKVKVISISGTSKPTVNKIPFVKVDETPLWIDGKPDPIDPIRNDSEGDERVLLSSSQIQSYFSKELDYDHGEIVDQSENIIADLLEENLDKIYPAPVIRDELSFWFASPVDVEIEDPDGKIITKESSSIENKLAQYTGESKPDGFKYVSIPNPIKGDYRLKLTGNGTGEYHIGAIYADYKNNIPDQESEKEGAISEGDKKEYKISYDPQTVDDPISDIAPSDTISPVISIASPENGKDYINDRYDLPAEYSVEDESPTSENIQLDGDTFLEDQIDLSLEHLGEHTFKIISTDEANNMSEESSVFVNTTNLDAIQNNLEHYFDLGFVENTIGFKYFRTKLENLGKLFDLLEKIENSDLKPKPKDAAVKALKKVINLEIEMIIRQLEKKSPRWIDENASHILVESLEAIKIK
jgi:pimeloyl-ACP methyl ester carboxylesterase